MTTCQNTRQGEKPFNSELFDPIRSDQSWVWAAESTAMGYIGHIFKTRQSMGSLTAQYTLITQTRVRIAFACSLVLYDRCS